MELCFISQGHIFEYEISVLKQTILKEHLAMDDHTVFTRNEQHVRLGKSYERSLHTKLHLSIQSSRLFCSVLSSLDNPEISAVMKPFSDYFSNSICYHFGFGHNRTPGFGTADSMFLPTFLSDSDALNYALEHLKKLGMPVQFFMTDSACPQAGYRIRSHLTGLEHTYLAPIQDFSSGICKYLLLFTQIYELQKKGGTLIIDNFSNYMHPNIIKYVLNLFQSASNNNMQLIFTTYDVSALNNRQFRRDEVAFIDLNEYQESRLYTLADIKVRSDASYSKDYLLGKYGAIPLIQEEL